MRIRIGNQTNCNVPAELPFTFALNNGFDAFEWFSDPGHVGWHEDEMSKEERTRVRILAQNHDMRMSVHAPWAADPTSLRGSAAIRRSMFFAQDVCAALVNIHLFPQHEVSLYVDSLIPLIEVAILSGVYLSLENTRQTSPEYVNAIFAQLTEIPTAIGRVGMCLDMGHANLYEETRYDYLAYVDQLGEHVPIIHWHAHENWGDRDSHLPLFTGAAARNELGVRALIRRMQARGFAGSVVMEQWPTPPEILIETRSHLMNLWNEVAVENGGKI